MLWLAPLVLAILLTVPLVVQRVHRPTRLFLARISLWLFGDYVADESPRKEEQRQQMRAAHVEVTHRVYASKTLLYATMLGIVGSVFGVYAAALVVFMLSITTSAVASAVPDALSFLVGITEIKRIGATTWFVLLLVSSATVGSGLAFATYYVRWKQLAQRAKGRAGRIDATLPRTVAFVYALSRSGMAFPKVLNTLTENREVYGEAAIEISVAVRDMNTFGTDVLTALRRLSSRTPSESMEEFAENLSSVLGSGRSLSEFLKSQYERYQEEAESQQRQYLDLLATFAEAYVTVLVAGALFLITILTVIGLVLTDTLPLLRLFVYLGVPLGSLGFIFYISSVTEDVQAGDIEVERTETDTSVQGFGVPDGAELTDGGGTPSIPDGGAVAAKWQASRERLERYERFQQVLQWVANPVDAVLEFPWVTFGATIPLALTWVYLRVGGTLPNGFVPAVKAVDEPLAEGLLLVAIGYAVVYEYNKRQLRDMEAAVPDFLERMASVNEAGMTVVESIHRLTRSDLEGLTPEIQRTWRDIEWGADVETALNRLDRRVDSPMVSRSVTLINNSMNASGDIAPVLEIAADEARMTRRLRRERRQEMFTYLMVIYVSFFVFLGIIAALDQSFLPAIQSANITGQSGGGNVPAGGGLSSGLLSGVREVNTDAYTTLFFHASVLQAVWSGLTAGLLGEGSIADGVKHTVILLALALVTFRLL